jgi:Family of unknown function (DUF5946)
MAGDVPLLELVTALSEHTSSDAEVVAPPLDAADPMCRCVGCGATVRDVPGPTHPYIDASPGCWAAFVEVLAREYGDLRYPPLHRVTVDAYAAQHPGTPSPRSSCSVALHLIGLHLVLERGERPERATRAMRRAAARRSEFARLRPPASLGALTILDVRGARGSADRASRMWRWVRSVWSAWSPHHATVRGWAGSQGDLPPLTSAHP